MDDNKIIQRVKKPRTQAQIDATKKMLEGRRKWEGSFGFHDFITDISDWKDASKFGYGYMNYPEANAHNERNGAQKFTEPDVAGPPTGSGRRIKDPTGSIKSRPAMVDEQPKNRGPFDLIEEKIKTFTTLIKKQVQADETMQQAGKGVKEFYSDAYRWLENNITRGRCK